MPVQHTYTMKAGTTSKLLLVYATSAESTLGQDGTRQGSFRRQCSLHSRGGFGGPPSPDGTPVALANGRSGALAEVDPELAAWSCINSARRMKCWRKVLRALFC